MSNLNGKPEFYIRFDYRAVYLAYRNNEENRVLEYPFTPAGIEIYERVRDDIKKTNNLLVGRWTIEMLMMNLDIDTPNPKASTIVKGRNLTTGLPDQVTITREQLSDIIEPLLKRVISIMTYNWRNFMSKTYQEKVAELGFLIVKGDFPLPKNFDKLLETALSIPIINTIRDHD